jgi:hypothetical protein
VSSNATGSRDLDANETILVVGGRVVCRLAGADFAVGSGQPGSLDASGLAR